MSWTPWILPPVKANAVDFTKEVSYHDLDDQTVPNACLIHIKPLGYQYGKFIVVFSINSAHTTWLIIPTTMFLQGAHGIR